MSDECKFCKVSPCALGLAVGVAKGAFMLLLAWSAYFFGYGRAMVEHIAAWHHGYASSLMGGVVGGACGLITGFVVGYVIGFLYNFFVARCPKISCKIEM